MAESKSYLCECGREFNKPNSFNGHKSHCKLHMIVQGKLERFILDDHRRHQNLLGTCAKKKQHFLEEQREKENAALEVWISEQHICERCGRIMNTLYGSGKFCSRACANKRTHSIESRKKTSDKLKGLVRENLENNPVTRRKDNILDRYYASPKTCRICGKVLPYELRNNKTCSKECKHLAHVANGKKSASIKTLRSKNEIYFCNLCKSTFDNVSNNEAIFDGWDADVILKDQKIAILWNGIWHYRYVRGKQSLKQIQNRDRIKISKIKEAGYYPFIIKDPASENSVFVEDKFKEFLQMFEDKNYLNSDIIEL